MKLFPGHKLDDVGEDEPVFLIRARDAEGPSILRKYAFLLRARHGANDLAGHVEAFADECFAWQHAEGNSAPPPPPDGEPVLVGETGPEPFEEVSRERLEANAGKRKAKS